MIDKRQIHKGINHAIEHIKNGDYELAVNLLQEEIEKDKKNRRKEDANK